MELSEVWLIGSMIGDPVTDDELREILPGQEMYTGKETRAEKADRVLMQQQKRNETMLILLSTPSSAVLQLAPGL